MPRPQIAIAAAVAALFAVPAHADQVLHVGITVSARNVDVDGNDVRLNGDVRIAATPEQHLVLESAKNGLRVTFSANQDRTITVTPFDTKSEAVAFTVDGVLLTDKHGNSLTIISGSTLPSIASTTTPPPAPPSTPATATLPKPSPIPSTDPVSVTIVQTAPPAEAQPKKKERYHDPVTDRGSVIP